MSLTESQIKTDVQILRDIKQDPAIDYPHIQMALDDAMEIMQNYRNENKDHNNVDHPSHYSGSCDFECIDVMCAVFDEDTVGLFCLCNAFKYLWRHTNKNGKEDVDKAAWYLKKYEEIQKYNLAWTPHFSNKVDWLNRELEKARAYYDEEGKV